MYVRPCTLNLVLLFGPINPFTLHRLSITFSTSFPLMYLHIPFWGFRTKRELPQPHKINCCSIAIHDNVTLHYLFQRLLASKKRVYMLGVQFMHKLKTPSWQRTDSCQFDLLTECIFKSQSFEKNNILSWRIRTFYPGECTQKLNMKWRLQWWWKEGIRQVIGYKQWLSFKHA